MAPNLIGNSFILAESALVPDTVEKPHSTSLYRVPTTVESSKQNANTSKQSVEVSSIKKDDYKWKIVWRNTISFLIIHLFAVYGLYITITESLFKEYLWGHIVGICGGYGVTVGAHRLWSHRSYKAKLPLRIILMIFQTIAFQNNIYEWVRDHRAHHKFTDTDGDPHNSQRGFFFSHMGWLLVRKHPEVKRKGKLIDMSDLEADPVVMFQKRHYMTLMPLLCFIVPALVPYFFMGANFRVCFFCCSILRWVISLHLTWLVNSAAHMWGMKPYEKDISPTDSYTVGILAQGEGWHNYHHVFPWDYKAGELGHYSINSSTAIIDFFAKIGWAYDLKVVSDDIIKKRVKRTGDGSHTYSKSLNLMENSVKECNNNCTEHDDNTEAPQNFWGWDDKDVSDKDRKTVTILHTRSN